MEGGRAWWPESLSLWQGQSCEFTISWNVTWGDSQHGEGGNSRSAGAEEKAPPTVNTPGMCGPGPWDGDVCTWLMGQVLSQGSRKEGQGRVRALDGWGASGVGGMARCLQG